MSSHPSSPMKSVDMEEDKFESPQKDSNNKLEEELSPRESNSIGLTSPERTLANDIFASPASSEKSVEFKSSQVLFSPTKLLEEEEDLNEIESANKSDAESNIDDSSSSSEDENEENEDETPEDTEGQIVNKVVAAEIEAVKEIERGPTEAELRRMKLIELDPDEADEKIERFKRLGTEQISKATGLSRQDRITKLRQSRSFLASLWKNKQYLDVIETYMEKQLGRLFGDIDAPFDPIAYIEQDTFSDEEEEKQQQQQQLSEQAQLLAQNKRISEEPDMIALSDSEDEDEVEQQTKETEEIQTTTVTTTIVSEIKQEPTSSSHVQTLLFEKTQQRKLFLAPVRVPRASRAALMISLRQKVQQTATENYCHQKRIKQEELNQHLQIADQCRALVELLRDHFDEKEQRIIAERQARYAQMADDDEDAEFGEETGLGEGKFLTDEERRMLFSRYQRRYENSSDSDSDSNYDSDNEGEEDEGNDDENIDDANENNEAVQEELHVNDDLAAYDTDKAQFNSEESSPKESQMAVDEEDVVDNEEEQVIVRKRSTLVSTLQDEDDDVLNETQKNEVLDASNKENEENMVLEHDEDKPAKATKKILYGRRQVGFSQSVVEKPLSDTIHNNAQENADDNDAHSLADSVESQTEQDTLLGTSSDTIKDDENHIDTVNDTETTENQENETQEDTPEDVSEADKASKTHKKKKKMNTGNALYRMMLEEEEQRVRSHKRNQFIDDEAEEEEEEAHQSGLFDFGFGNLSNLKDAEDEKHAMTLQKGDLDHIVDDLSEGEGDEEAEREARYQMELKEDRERTKMIVEAITEGHDTMRAKKNRRKQGYSFETLVSGRNKANDQGGGKEGEAAAEEEEEMDLEEMLLKGMAKKMDQEKRRRYNDEDDDSDEDAFDEDDDLPEGDEDLLQQAFHHANEDLQEGYVDSDGKVWTKEMIQVEKEQRQREKEHKRMEYLRRKQMDKDFKMRRELRYQQMQRLQRSVSHSHVSSSTTDSQPSDIAHNGDQNHSYASVGVLQQQGLLPASLPKNARVNPAIFARLDGNSSQGFAVPVSHHTATRAHSQIKRTVSVNQTLRKIRSVSNGNGSNSNLLPPTSLSRSTSLANFNTSNNTNNGNARYSGELSRLELETGIGLVRSTSNNGNSNNNGSNVGLFQLVTNQSSSSHSNSALHNHTNAKLLSKKRSFSALLHENSNHNNNSRLHAPPPKRLARSVSSSTAVSTTTLFVETTAASASGAMEEGSQKWSRSASTTNENLSNQQQPGSAGQNQSLFAKLGAAKQGAGGLKRTFSVMSTTIAQ